MSFRWFIYYCAVCGGAAAFVGWAFGAPFGLGILEDSVKGLFVGMMIGAALAVIDSLCNFSQSGVALAVLRVLVAGLIGCLAGFLGALVGSGLHHWTHTIPFVGEFFRVFGWTLTGLLIGASVGVFDLLASVAKKQDPSGSLKKVINGLIGGGVGGLLGGLLFVLLLEGLGGLFSGETDLLQTLWSPAALGYEILGLIIGL